ncbi:MAG TPA: IclR family transcriptional regulator [Thermoanaerobacterales bacterium]|nr:IclR family transcriptional regulator [Thermoanaerobacterales bacterium]
MKRKGFVYSVGKAFAIIEMLTKSPAGLTISYISSELEWSKSTVHRFLSTLLELGYVRQKEDNSYCLSLKFLAISNSIINSLELRDIAKPFLQRLAKEAGTDVHLATLEGFDAVFVDRVDGDVPLTTNFHIGRRAPAYCTAVGKVMLAQMSDEELERRAPSNAFKPFTQNTITSLVELKKQLTIIRRQEFAIDNSEHNVEIGCIASGIKDFQGKTVAAVSVSGPVEKVLGESSSDLVLIVKKCAKHISSNLGYVSND